MKEASHHPFIRPDVLPAVLVGFLGTMGPAMTLPLWVFFLKEEIGLDGAKVGLVGATFFLGKFLGSFVYGPAADTYGRKPVHIITLVWSAVSFAMLAFVDCFWQIALCRFFGGFFGVMRLSQVFVSSTVADRLGEEVEQGVLGAQTGRALAMSSGLGMICGLLFMSASVGPLGMGRRSIFVIAGAICLAAALLCAALVEESLNPDHQRQRLAKQGRSKGFGSFAEWLPLMPLAFFVFLMTISFDFIGVSYPSLLLARFGYGDVIYGAIIGSFAVIAFLIPAVVFPWLTSKGNVGPWACVQCAMALTSVGAFGMVFLRPFQPHLVSAFVMDAGLSLFLVTLPTLCSLLAPKGLLATAQAGSTGLGALGSMVGNLVGGQLTDWNVEAPFFAVGYLAGSAALLVTWFRSSLENLKEREPILQR